MMYEDRPMQGNVNPQMVQGMPNQMTPQMVQGMSNQMYPTKVQGMPNQMKGMPNQMKGMPNQMYLTGVQGAYQKPVHGDVKHECRKYMNYHVQAKMQDGSDMEGIITDMDDQSVEMLVPEEVDEEEVRDNRQQYGYGGDYGRRRFRRFRRRRFPFFNIVIVQPYPYPYPYSQYGY
jgi:hypothetical protein